MLAILAVDLQYLKRFKWAYYLGKGAG